MQQMPERKQPLVETELRNPSDSGEVCSYVAVRRVATYTQLRCAPATTLRLGSQESFNSPADDNA